jgi:hypothetical protein
MNAEGRPMFHGLWRLLFGLVWLVAAGVLFVRSGPMALAGWAGLLLGVWNLARWYQLRQRPRAYHPPLRPGPTGGYEYNPEFDFQKMDREGDASATDTKELP